MFSNPAFGFRSASQAVADLSRIYYTLFRISEVYGKNAGYAKAYAGAKSNALAYGDFTDPNFAIRV